MKVRGNRAQTYLKNQSCPVEYNSFLHRPVVTAGRPSSPLGYHSFSLACPTLPSILRKPLQ